MNNPSVGVSEIMLRWCFRKVIGTIPVFFLKKQAGGYDRNLPASEAKQPVCSETIRKTLPAGLKTAIKQSDGFREPSLCYTLFSL